MLLYHDDKGSHKQATGTTCHSVAIAPSKFVCLTMCYLPSKCVPKINYFLSLPFFPFLVEPTCARQGRAAFGSARGALLAARSATATASVFQAAETSATLQCKSLYYT